MSAHPPTTAPPSLRGLAAAVPQLEPWLDRARTVGAGATNAEGGDPGSHADPRLLVRHLGHYLAAAELAGPVPWLLDVGCGTGAFTGWLAERLGADVVVADHDPVVLARAGVVAGAVAELHDVADATPAPLVTAMEVLEHVPRPDQERFCRALLSAVAPGGRLVLSTPDESLYPGGWSGYAPHVGCVTAPQLRELLWRAGAAQVAVWRITGGPFDTPAPRRWLEALGNRVWTLLGRVLPSATEVLAGGGRGARPDLVEVLGRLDLDAVTVTPPSEGRGGSLLAVARV